MTNTIIAEVNNASKKYISGDSMITALHPTSITIHKGELILLLGPSGSGKTTLLSLLGCVIYPTDGIVTLMGQVTTKLNDKDLSELRLKQIGFVFQNYNLVAPLTAYENVMIPLQLQKIPKAIAKKKALQALESVGMIDRMNNTPAKLSGGQQQRIAIARALVNDPSLILCDEPTASLDPESVDYVMSHFSSLASQGRTVIIVTHDHRLIKYADIIYKVEAGMVERMIQNELNFENV